jgi:hypothetical protein
MYAPIDCMAVLAASTLFAAAAVAQTARDVRGPSPLVAIENEAPARLIVDPPLAEQLAQGLVFIQYTTASYRYSARARSTYRRVSATSMSRSTKRLGILSMPVARQ